MTTDALTEPVQTRNPPPRLRRRSDFVRVSKTGARLSTPAFALQAADRADDEAARFGFTVTKKVAGAVGRNRIRRRLKEALRLGGPLGPLGARPGCDYVFVARRAALTAPFTEILSQMADGFARLDRRGAAGPRRKLKDRPSAP